MKSTFEDDFREEVCDIKLVASDDTLMIPRSFIESISDVMEISEEEFEKGRGKSKPKIQVFRLNVTVEEVVKALAFYKPRHFKKINGESNLGYLDRVLHTEARVAVICTLLGVLYKKNL